MPDSPRGAGSGRSRLLLGRYLEEIAELEDFAEQEWLEVVADALVFAKNLERILITLCY
jgi:hypothetical protein